MREAYAFAFISLNRSPIMKSKRFFKDLSAFICKHKLIFILVAATLVVAAITATAIILSQENTPPLGGGYRPDTNPVTSGEEQRVYYYDLPGGEVLLTLQENWKFTMTGPEMNKSGDYSMSGEDKIILDFVRNIDGIATATLNEKTVVMTLDGAKLTFREKIDFTVSFNTNGGSAVSSVTVTNGNTVSAPSKAPTKSGCEFAGWYADEEFTKPFGFGITLITGDTVIYAKWTEATP